MMMMPSVRSTRRRPVRQDLTEHEAHPIHPSHPSLLGQRKATEDLRGAGWNDGPLGKEKKKKVCGVGRVRRNWDIKPPHPKFFTFLIDFLFASLFKTHHISSFVPSFLFPETRYHPFSSQYGSSHLDRSISSMAYKSPALTLTIPRFVKESPYPPPPPPSPSEPQRSG